MRITVQIPYVGEFEPRKGARRLRYRRGGRVFLMQARPGDPVAQIEAEAAKIAAQHFGEAAPLAHGSLGRVFEVVRQRLPIVR